MWLSIRFPLLPLETVAQETVAPEASVSSMDCPGSHKEQAVVENNRIICANHIASERGIRVNQSITSAYALCDEIQLFERNLQQEQQRIKGLALLAYAFSSSITVESNALLLLEISRSLKLYDGLENLLNLLKGELKKEHMTFQMGIGNTAKSAEILSFKPLDYSLKCWQKVPQQIDRLKMESQLSGLPVELIGVHPGTIEKIQSVGIKKLAELKQLPDSAIRKRFGKEISHYLLKLYGKLPDLKKCFQPPEIFSEKIEFVDVIHHRQGLLFPVKRLVKNLCRFLTLKQKHCQCLHWELFDSNKNMIGFDVLVSEPQINGKVFIELTLLNLERYTLHAPIEAVSLEVNKLVDLHTQNQQLFDNEESFKQNREFINRIRAKLGSNSCYALQQKQEHVPELACRQTAEIVDAIDTVDTVNIFDTRNVAVNDFETEEMTTRPGWLLSHPKPIQHNQRKLLWHGELQIISSQERITNYWWKKKIARDYFLAEHEDGTIYWVFYDQLRKQWFIHGIYS